MSENQEQPSPVTTDTTPQSGEVKAPSFTQDDVNRIIGKEKKDAKEQTVKSILAEFGLEKMDDLKGVVESFRKAKDAEMSEAQKAQAEAEKARKEAETYRNELANMKAAQVESAKSSALLSALRGAGVNSEKEVNRLLILLKAEQAEQIAAIFTEDAKADATKLEAFVKQVQSDYSGYFASAGAGSPALPNGVPISSRQVVLEQIQAEIKRKHGSL